MLVSLSSFALEMTDGSVKTRRPLRTRILQNFHLVWLDENLDESNEEYHQSIQQFQQVVSTVNTFPDIDECLDFVSDLTNDTALLIVSRQFADDVLAVVHELSQVHAIYIVCKTESELKRWENASSKIHGAYTDMPSICQKIRADSKVCDRNALSLSFLPQADASAVRDLDTLNCSFMYTQILRDILLTIDFTQEHVEQFAAFCREQFADSATQLAFVEQIEKEYYKRSALSWYSSDSFLYGMLNRALRVMDAEVIVQMGFFLRDIHQDITELHDEQFGDLDLWDPFPVYRGQSLSVHDFVQLRASHGGLLSFNNFLSTSRARDVGQLYAESNLGDPQVISVLFVIALDPAVAVTSFAFIAGKSQFGDENEILFSMHSIFRIGDMKQSDKHERLWQVELTLTADHDVELQRLTKRLQEETSLGSNGWFRLGQLMIQLGRFEQAKALYEVLLKQTADPRETAHLFAMLGTVSSHQGNYSTAMKYCQQSLRLSQRYFPADHPYIISCYNQICSLLDRMGRYSQGIEYLQRMLALRQRTLPADHPDLVESYNNIGIMYKNMGEYRKALVYHEKSLQIIQSSLLMNHPDVAILYDNISDVYQKLDDHPRALEYCQKALQLRQRILPATHPDIASSYQNTGLMHMIMGKYSRALGCLQQALDIGQKTLPSTHPILASIYNDLGVVCGNLGEYSTAIEYLEKSIEICRQSLPSNHPYLATCYSNMAEKLMKTKAFSSALDYLQKCLNIREQSLPANHPELDSSYNNIATVYMHLGDYTQAHHYLVKMRASNQQTASRPDLALSTFYNNMAAVHYGRGEYPVALEYFEKALRIREQLLPADRPDLATSYNNCGTLLACNADYAKALTYLERARTIWQRSLPADHPQNEELRRSIETLRKYL